MASSVSVSVPIWFGLMRMLLRDLALDALLQDRCVGDEQIVADELDLVAQAFGSRCAQPSQSFSAMPSSIDTIG